MPRVANIESSEVLCTSRLKAVDKYSKLINSAGRKCTKPLTIQYLPTGDLQEHGEGGGKGIKDNVAK